MIVMWFRAVGLQGFRLQSGARDQKQSGFERDLTLETRVAAGELAS